jgi:phosphoglycerate dehydrogenase-like enzyme
MGEESGLAAIRSLLYSRQAIVSMKVLILLHHRFDLWTAPAWVAERLRKEFPDVTFAQFDDYERAAPDLRDAEVLVGWSIRPEQLREAKRLKWIHSPAAAVHQLMFRELVESPIIVTNGRDVHGPVVAEHALALIFALAKRLPSAVRHQQKQEWAQAMIWHAEPRPREVADATLLLLGLGSIGRETATRAKAMGMRVIAVREHPEQGAEGCDAVFGMRDLDEQVTGADFVVLAAPLTEKTKGIMNAERLGMMKKTSYLINVSRGPLIDDEALVTALREKRIGGAGLDVFPQEPLPSDSPYWSLENCLITPHTAALTERVWERQLVLLTDNLHRYRAGKPLRNLVDKRRGY